MNGIIPWSPFRELEEMHNRLSTLFDRTPIRRDNRQEALATTEWAPLVDISENDKSYTITVEVPEIKREDLKVSVERGVLTVSGERKRETEEKERKYHRVERSYGSFVRTFSLPDDASPDQISASCRDGILTVNIGKSTPARPRSVEVKVE